MNPKDAKGFKFISVIFLIDGNRNVLTQRVLKKWSGRLRIRSCRSARNLGGLNAGGIQQALCFANQVEWQ